MARQMKDSGIEWIGEIPENWNIGKVKNGVVKVGSGKTPLGGVENFADEGILFLRSQNVYDTGLVLDSPTYITAEVDEEMKSTRVYPRDVLLNITGGSIGRCCIFPDTLNQANVNQHVSIIRVQENAFTPQYMHYYWMSAGRIAIDLYQTGGNREGMSADAIKNTPIPIVSIDEQEKITNFLDRKCAEIDAVIERTKATIEEYKKLKQAVITEAVTKGVRGPRPMKDSGIEWIGEIPEGWEVRKCKHISAFINGYAFDSADLVIDFRYPVIRIGDIKSGFVDFEHCQGVQWNQGLDNYKIQTNDILLAMSGATVGKVGLATPTNDSYINQRVGILRSNCYKYLFYALSTDCFVEYILLKASGSAQPNVSGIVCGNFPLPYPPDDEREEITVFLDEKCAALDTLIAKKTALLTELETYKKSLIYEYVTGKKEV